MIQLPQAHAQLITEAIQAAQAAGELPAFDLPDINVQPTAQQEFGDYAYPAMALAKLARKAPAQIAQTIVNHLPAREWLLSAEVAGSGYINFRLNPTWLAAQVEAIITDGESFGNLEIGKGKRAQVEFVSANPTGPLHIGRSRGAIVGDATARALEAAGYDVQREYYFNNAGVQMINLGKSLKARYLEALGKLDQLPDETEKWFYRGEYLKDFAEQIAAEHGESWLDHDWQPFKQYAEKQMFEVIRTTLQRVNIRHDAFFNENTLFDGGETNRVIAALKANNDLYEAVVWDGASDEERTEATAKNYAAAWWFRSSRYGDDKDRVLMKSDGQATYTLPDIAYHMNKLERGFDLAVNILGADHGAQYKVVQYGVTSLGQDASKIQVIIVQLVRMIRDGKEVKLSTRAGNYETLDDLIDATSIDAVRYGLLARSPNTHLDFDMDRAIASNNDNPVYYIQNAHVRCAGIFREAAARGFSDDGALDLSLLGAHELAFIKKALELPTVIETAATQLEPHRIAFYAHELAGVFHPVYDNVRVLHTEVDPATAKARLRFYRAAQVALKRVLDLMGMTAPEIM